MITVTVEHRVTSAPPRPTPRVVEIAAMFGLGLDRRREVTIIPRTQVSLPIPGPGVVFVTGPSGSGKSTLLRLIKHALRERGCRVVEARAAIDAAQDEAANPRAQPSPAVAASVIDLVAPDEPLKTAMEFLSLAGLSDAFVMLRGPGELSDGQRFRYELARAMVAATHPPHAGLADAESDRVVIVLDEFAATLDRLTAATLARNVRRWADRGGATFILATTHDDLIDALRPDVIIHKGLGDAIEVAMRNAPGTPSAGAIPPRSSDGVRIEPGTLDDYRALSHLHYRSHHVGGATSVLRAVVRTPAVVGSFLQRRGGREVVGVLVRALPALCCAARDWATAGRYASLTPRERGIVLNREVRCISRVIVEPRFRGMGLAVNLVRHALQHPEHESIVVTEAIAAMGRVNPFFERAGMTRFDLPPHCRHAHARLLDALEFAGLVPSDLAAGIGPVADPHPWLVAEVRRFLHAARRMRRENMDAMNDRQLLRAAAERLMLQPVYFLFTHAARDAREKTTPC